MDIVQYYTNGTDKSVIHASLWHNVLSGCYATDSGYNCTATCESAWFKIWNPKAAYSKADVCDRAFIGHYQNVMKYDCKVGGVDYLWYEKSWIGKSHIDAIVIEDKEPIPPKKYKKQGKCIWEYNTLGLWSIGK